ncbi:MAG: carbamoyl-phosphate synthase large subunit, partial [Lentisphaeria bacterium]|nr:carbamoyl-phosphate synthase large subunit [Lentisphaeria bacterium]
DKLGTQMRAVGEVMSIGKTYREAFQKAIRSLERSTAGLGFYKDLNSLTLEELLEKLKVATSYRQFAMYEALRKGATVEQLHKLTHIKQYFLDEMKALVDEEQSILAYKGQMIPDPMLIQAKKDGFSDQYLASILDISEDAIREKRIALGVTEAWEAVPVSGVDDACYWYSSYNLAKDESTASPNAKKVMVLGGGPIRIGQGIEFDYCCVHAATELRKLGYETIMVNCNPETVSTDYDTSDKLYFEPLTLEDVLAIYKKEKPLGVIVQFGGQTPLNLADKLEKNGVRILGTSPATIDMAEDRDLFRKMMDKMGIPMPESGMASTLDEALDIARKIGFPVMVRPSFVLGGRGMEVVHDEDMLREYVLKAEEEVSPDRPILIDRFLDDAMEAEADAISDGTDAFVPSVMEHIELAGIHSGDSACVIPPPSMGEKFEKEIKDITRRIAIEMGVVGLMNVQFAICQGKVYVIEANPRASRTVPLVSKVCGISMARLATDTMMGKKLSELNLKELKITHFGVKEAVFPFPMLPEVDPVLGPEMRSTGEVLGLSPDLGLAFFKAEEAAKPALPQKGTVLITVAPRDHQAILPAARQFVADGFRIVATEGTLKSLQAAGIPAEPVAKIGEGRPDILDELKNGRIDLVINTPIGKSSQIDDSYIRKNAIRYGVPYFTTVAAATACANGIHAKLNGSDGVKSLQEYHQDLHR